jgi:hypothetical protein
VPRPKKGAPPADRRHSGDQARVSVRDKTGRRREILLGACDSPESKIVYQSILALLRAYRGYYPFADVEQPVPAGGLTVDQVILAWWKDAERRYGAESSELKHYKYALRHLRTLFATLPAEEFSPKKFKAVSQRMVDALEFQVRRVAEGAAPRWLGEDRVDLEKSVALLKKKTWAKVEVLASRQALSRTVINRHLVRSSPTRRDKATAARVLADWIRRADASGIKILHKMAATLGAHRQGILAYYDHRISNGPLEGTNNKIKTMQRQAYGFRDHEFFKLKIYSLHQTRYALVG